MSRIKPKPAVAPPPPRVAIAQAPRPAAPQTASRAWGPGNVKPAAESGAAAATRTAEAFYGAFAARDLNAMGFCYDKKAKFHDPLFGKLEGADKVMEMWKTIMPAANPATFKIEPQVGKPTPNADGTFTVKVHWDAHYDLGARHVDNHSDTTLTIKDGKILEQRDDWDLHKWTQQALPIGRGSAALDRGISFAAHSFVELKAHFDKMTHR